MLIIAATSIIAKKSVNVNPHVADRGHIKNIDNSNPTNAVNIKLPGNGAILAFIFTQK